MSLGKRPRRPMTRTTSMTELAGEIFADVQVLQPLDQERAHQGHQRYRQRAAAAAAAKADGGGGKRTYGGSAGVEGLETRYLEAMVAPWSTGNRRNSGDFGVVEVASFLKACSLCKRRLGPGRDTFMYRGDIAFCSLECRQQQMNLDERKEKCSLTSMKDTPTPATGSSEQSTAA